MLLPYVQQAEVDPRKITDYLLNASHPDNGGKAAFFIGWGFSSTAWPTMRKALLDLIAHADIESEEVGPWGRKYVVVGPLDGPRGMTPPVLTVWIVDAGRHVSRLVTAYPKTKESLQ